MRRTRPLARQTPLAGQMQVVAAVLLTLVTATTVVAINSTSNLTSNLTDLLPTGLNEFFFKTVEIWAGTSIDFDVAEQLRIWLMMDNKTAIPNETLHIKYSGQNITQNLTVFTSDEGYAPVELEPGNYSFNVSFPGGEFLLPSQLSFEVEIEFVNKTVNESLNKTQVNGTIINETAIEPVNETQAPDENVIDIEKPTGELDVVIDFPQRVTRDMAFNITVELLNTGDGTASDIVFEWTIPEGFTILSPECGDVPAGGSCIVQVMLTPSLSTSPGATEAKLKVVYR